MKKDFTIFFLCIIIVILGFIVVDLRLQLDGNYTSIVLQTQKEKIVFAGDSITDGYDVNSYYQYDDKIIVNSGIGGYKTTNILSRFYNVIEQHNADKLFLLIGTNDLNNKGHDNVSEVVKNTEEILAKTKELSPQTKIYYQTIYPVIPSDKVGLRNNTDIRKINEQMRTYCEANGITYIDVYSVLADEDGNLNKDYTTDGLHLNSSGYDVVTSLLRPYVEE